MKQLYVLFLFLFCFPIYAYISEDTTCTVAEVNAFNNIAHLRPDFVRNIYVCDSGYFLPANTLGCQQCPSGYTCPGGTFKFNEFNAQGINMPEALEQNSNNTCSVNFLNAVNNISHLRPIFIKNDTITVNFIDGENTETVTCTYDTDFTVPDAPAPRVGYVFTGWKVKNNNE